MHSNKQKIAKIFSQLYNFVWCWKSFKQAVLKLSRKTIVGDGKHLPPPLPSRDRVKHFQIFIKVSSFVHRNPVY